MSYFDAEAAGFVKSFLERLPTTDTGRPFQLYPWQTEALDQFYGTMLEDAGDVLRAYQYLYLELPKKNGKSELAAGLGLYHLFADGERNAEVYLCAADRDNASIVFNAALYMATTAPWTAKMIERGELSIKESQKTIYYRQRVTAENGGSHWIVVGRLKVLSAESETKHGLRPSCVIFDELHAQPNRKLWDVMTTGAGSGRLQPAWIVLTTAGDDPDRHSIGWEIHERAVAVRDARALRKLREAGGDPRSILSLRHVDESDMDAAQEALLARDLPEWLPVLYGLTALYGDDPDDLARVDIYDEALWYRCNPSLGGHLKLRTLRAEARNARQSETSERLFRWLRLNQWISTKSVSWMPLTLYDKLQWGPSTRAEREQWISEQLRGKLCYAGLDLSSTTDLTALVLFFPAQPGLERSIWLPYIWHSGYELDEAERRDHVSYRDWARAGFLRIGEGIIDYDEVEEAVRAAAQRYRLQLLGVDPYLSRTITQRLQGIPLVEIPQDMKNMSPAMKEIETGMRRHEILHTHNTCYRWTFGNVRVYVDGNENMKPMKNRSPGRIDPPVATIIAVAAWMIGRNQRTLADAIGASGFSL